MTDAMRSTRKHFSIRKYGAIGEVIIRSNGTAETTETTNWDDGT
jgi:hypothetical protein